MYEPEVRCIRTTKLRLTPLIFEPGKKIKQTFTFSALVRPFYFH